MTSDDDPCPACGETEGTCYDSEAGRFRLWCLFCGYWTGWHPDLALARLEWRKRSEAPRG